MLFDLNYKLNSEEKLVTIARKHWFLIVPNLTEVAIIIALLIIFVNKFSTPDTKFTIVAVLIGCFVLYSAYSWILLRIDYFIVTSDRIIKVDQRGVWNREISEILISNISTIILSEKGVAASVLKFGSIEITLRDSTSFNMTNIIDSIKVYQGLTKLKGIKKV